MWIVLPFELNVKVEMAGRAWVGKDNRELSSQSILQLKHEHQTHSQALLLMKLSLFERTGKKAREEGTYLQL